MRRSVLGAAVILGFNALDVSAHAQEPAYVLFLCTEFIGQPDLTSCSELQVGRYKTKPLCELVIPRLVAKNEREGSHMDDGDIHHWFSCDTPGANPARKS